MCLVSECHVCVTDRGGQGGDQIPLELEFEVAMGHLT